jgi:hypothetical protein
LLTDPELPPVPASAAPEIASPKASADAERRILFISNFPHIDGMEE